MSEDKVNFNKIMRKALFSLKTKKELEDIYSGKSLLSKLFVYSKDDYDEDPLLQYIVKCLEYFAFISDGFHKHINNWFNSDNKKFIDLLEKIEIFTPEESNNEEVMLKDEILNLLIKIPPSGSFKKYYNDSFYNISQQYNKNTTFNLLEQCFICRPWINHDQTEEFFTKVLAFCMDSENCPNFHDEFFSLLKKRYEATHQSSDNFPKIKEFKVHSEDQTGSERPDISIKEIKENGKTIIAIENKIDAPFDITQILRYCTLENGNSPIIFSITYKSDCNDESVQHILKDNDSIKKEVDIHDIKKKAKKQILENIGKINLSQWGGHLYWDDILNITTKTITKLNIETSKESIYLNYFKHLIEHLYFPFELQTTIPFPEGENEDTDEFRKKILKVFSTYFNKNAKQKFSNLKNIKKLYNLEIKKEYKKPNSKSWNGNDKNNKNIKIFHLLIKPNIDLSKFNKSININLPLTAIGIWFNIAGSKYTHDKNFKTNFIAHNLEINFELITLNKKDKEKKIQLDSLEGKCNKNEGLPEKLKELRRSEVYSLGEIERGYLAHSGEWSESIMMYLQSTLEEWDKKGYFEEIINWWGDDLLSVKDK
jgi:PD-(D/E)XK nuclease superfamily protein